MTLGRLNHVGVATPSIERSIETYRHLLGAQFIGEPFDLPAQGVRVCFVNAPNTQIELIEPYDATSPIANFLAKNPAGGQHHLCFEVPDIHDAVADLAAKGAKVLGEPRIGARAQEKEGLRFRRSLYVVEDVKAGDVVTAQNVRSIRPANGLPTDTFDTLAGRTFTRDAAKGTPMSWDLV